MRLIDAERFERRLMFTVDVDEICDDCLRSFLAEMSAEKTVEQVRHGHWKTVCNKDTAYIKMYRCSCCKDAFMLDEGEIEENGEYNYCPNCGARMDEKGAVTDGEDKG